ncbi:MAG: hypothetical protein A2675_03030 [Candidatus Yonathbacteria bacterium RIFCSPHIGHO2_01_FULL_51_10]|uniref:Uncharacterized protein n=1 Tax=Candidatus Yonathbacteria bacterium RIFCSPHIGHO2_01_FULL_51_10 TaxID=1802723 RepID=A0A1G2S3F3_9BACT|nr:MAG: hypothetical protein A2675_03030 [Candidatus Yonathbacteria bacterium RIFCSPHIGHO2_01_FULL_51_10]
MITMNISPPIRNVAGVILFCALLFFAYKFTMGKAAPQAPALIEQGPVNENGIVIVPESTMSNIAAIKSAHDRLTTLQHSGLDMSIFSDPVMQSLQDFRVPLTPTDPSQVSRGRVNPFAALPKTSN